MTNCANKNRSIYRHTEHYSNRQQHVGIRPVSIPLFSYIGLCLKSKAMMNAELWPRDRLILIRNEIFAKQRSFVSHQHKYRVSSDLPWKLSVKVRASGPDTQKPAPYNYILLLLVIRLRLNFDNSIIIIEAKLTALVNLSSVSLPIHRRTDVSTGCCDVHNQKSIRHSFFFICVYSLLLMFSFSFCRFFSFSSSRFEFEMFGDNKNEMASSLHASECVWLLGVAWNAGPNVMKCSNSMN